MNKQRMRKKDVMFIHRVELNFPGRIPNVWWDVHKIDSSLYIYHFKR